MRGPGQVAAASSGEGLCCAGGLRPDETSLKLLPKAGVWLPGAWLPAGCWGPSQEAGKKTKPPSPGAEVSGARLGKVPVTGDAGFLKHDLLREEVKGTPGRSLGMWWAGPKGRQRVGDGMWGMDKDWSAHTVGHQTATWEASNTPPAGHSLAVRCPVPLPGQHWILPESPPPP